ncbi:helix-turn-helix transcriptional regulator [Candidatus Uhrbacteria bacterium]|nr:helix-turn-helix transcriptional regulator [Candidatus Uhrbacteria bacterium]
MAENKQPEKTIGQKIKELRKKKDLTQEGLARKADLPYTTLVKIEGDAIQNPTLDTITKIAAGLEVSLDDLINS